MCCFFKNEETQILVWIITDCILNICYGFLLFFMLDDLIGYPGGIVGPIWSFTVIVAGIVLIFALKKSNTKFMLFWIFIMQYRSKVCVGSMGRSPRNDCAICLSKNIIQSTILYTHKIMQITSLTKNELPTHWYVYPCSFYTD